MIFSVIQGRRANHCACRVCGKIFSNQGNCNRHVETVHLKIKPFECPFCKNRFGQKIQLKGHVKVNHPNIYDDKCSGGFWEQAPFKCPICKSRFRQECQLQEHARINHPDNSNQTVLGQPLSSTVMARGPHSAYIIDI